MCFISQSVGGLFCYPRQINYVRADYFQKPHSSYLSLDIFGLLSLKTSFFSFSFYSQRSLSYGRYIPLKDSPCYLLQSQLQLQQTDSLYFSLKGLSGLIFQKKVQQSQLNYISDGVFFSFYGCSVSSFSFSCSQTLSLHCCSTIFFSSSSFSFFKVLCRMIYLLIEESAPFRSILSLSLESGLYKLLGSVY